MVPVGRVMANVAVPDPATLNDAAEPAPDANKVASPAFVIERTPAAVTRTSLEEVPGVIFPNDKGVVFVRERLVMRFADAVAVADWAKAAVPASRKAPATRLEVSFMTFSFRLWGGWW